MLEFHMIIFKLAQTLLFPTLMILDLVESKPQIQWFTSEILWNKAQVWNSQVIELMSLSTCNKIVLKIDKRACFKRQSKVQDHCSKVHKNQARLLKDQFKENPVYSSSDFLMDQEDSNNVMENSKDRSCHPRPHWPKDHCSIFNKRLIQLLCSQVITPQAPKPRSHPWGSSIFLLFKFILFAHLNS